MSKDLLYDWNIRLDPDDTGFAEAFELWKENNNPTTISEYEIE